MNSLQMNFKDFSNCPVIQKSKLLTSADMHTCGEPTHIVISGEPDMVGETMLDRKNYLHKNCDHIRTALMLEPRGHDEMFGAIICKPISKEADFGVIFMDAGGYLNMCGHGTIGAMTALVNLKLVDVKEPVTEITLEAPAGLVKGTVQVRNGIAESVSFKNVPSFLYKQNCEVYVKSLEKSVLLDIAFGGSFFAIVNKKQLGLEISPKDTKLISELGMELLAAANEQIPVQHPHLNISSIDLVEIYGEPKGEATLQNVVVFGKGQIDRSPCGTGTSAKIATLFTKGLLTKGEEFVYESIIGTKFRGKVLDSYQDGEHLMVVPEITASAQLIGINTIVINPDDPLKDGFSLTQ